MDVQEKELYWQAVVERNIFNAFLTLRFYWSINKLMDVHEKELYQLTVVDTDLFDALMTLALLLIN